MPPPPRRRRSCRPLRGAASAAGLLAAAAPAADRLARGFAAGARPGGGALAHRGPARPRASGAARRRPALAPGLHRGRAGRVARRIFDSGSLFGVGVPEAAVIALLGWFLLGPTELYSLAKRFGTWLGEARDFVGQAARQYESTLDDASTRKFVEGIRDTQRKVSEVATSFRGVADSLRDPLAIGATLESTLDRYDKKKVDPEPIDPKNTYPDLTMDEPEPVLTTAGGAAVGPRQPGPAADRRDAGVDAAAGAPQDARAAAAAEALERLDDRLAALDDLVFELEDIREGLRKDREELRALPGSQRPPQAAAAPASAPAGAADPAAAAAAAVASAARPPKAPPAAAAPLEAVGTAARSAARPAD